MRIRGREAAGLAAAAAWALLPWAVSDRLSLSIFVLIGLYVPVVAGVALLAGHAGQVSLGQAAFYGLGAYGSAILSTRLGVPPLLSIPAAVAVTGLAAYAIGRPIFLLRGHYLVVATLGLNVIVSVVLRQWVSLTGGASGIKDVPPLAVGPFEIRGDLGYYYVTGALAAASLVLCAHLVRSRYGRALQLVRTSETAAETLGIDPSRAKTGVFVLSAMLAAAPGALYAHYLAYVNPAPFEFTFSVDVLMMGVIGGLPHVPGALVGTALAVLLREALRSFVPRIFGGAATGEFESIAFGLLLAAVTVLSPDGLWPHLRDAALWAARGGRRRAAESRGTSSPADAAASARGEESVAPRALPARGAAQMVDADGAGDVVHGGRAAATAPVLEVEGVRRDFGGLTAVSGVSFTVRPGEVFAVIGPNGAGKTTLFNLVSGVLRVTAGRIALEGRALDRMPAHRVAALGVARTFQTPRLAPRLTARENVMAGLHMRLRAGMLGSLLGRARAEERRAREEAGRLLDTLGAGAFCDTPAGDLPFGALRLVELARALAARPKLLLLDEPASGLSAEERAALFRHVRRAADSGVAVLLVEHDMDFVLGLADHVLVLHHGEPIAWGTPEEIRRDERVLAAYLGAPAAAAGAAASPRPTRAPSGPPLLSVRDVRAGYGRIRVLHGVSFEVHEGEVVAILGPNGAGKTTLMRAVAGLLPAEGEVAYAGRRLDRLPAERMVALGVALVPERRELLESMSVRDHLILGAYARRGRGARREAAADLEEVLALFPDLREKAASPARSLSGGQQQMLAIARALMSRPRVLLLDEPLLGLAPKVVGEILETVARLRERGLAVVIVEQNAAATLRACDRAYVLRGGRIVHEGAAAELAREGRLRGLFIGSAAGGEGAG
ncbi:MAG: ATP-binding cassette domain-containing protein [Firmicutes bacterium]|nr:ATP-binding cassette domain-containing protein [Bacillota bacterium]